MPAGVLELQPEVVAFVARVQDELTNEAIPTSEQDADHHSAAGGADRSPAGSFVLRANSCAACL